MSLPSRWLDCPHSYIWPPYRPQSILRLVQKTLLHTPLLYLTINYVLHTLLLPLGFFLSREAIDQVWGALSLSLGHPTLSPFLARPVKRSSETRNLLVQTLNWMIQKPISCISMRSSTWCSQICDLIKCFTMSNSHICSYIHVVTKTYGIDYN